MSGAPVTIETRAGAMVLLTGAGTAEPPAGAIFARRSVFDHGLPMLAAPSYGAWPFPPQPDCPREALRMFVGGREA